MVPPTPTRTPKVSVALPAYNASHWINETLNSLRSQSFGDFELLVADDGSSDDTASIVSAAAAVDPRIKLMRLQHEGVVNARNTLIQRAQGEYIMFHDADDLSVAWRMERQTSFLDAHPDVVAVSSTIKKFSGPAQLPQLREAVDAGWVYVDTAIRPFRYTRKAFPFPACMIRKSAALELGGFRPYFSYAEDADFIYRLAERGKLAVLNEVLFYYRQHATNTSRRAPYLQTESSVLSRVVARRRRTGRPDNLLEQKPPFQRIFTSGLTPLEIAEVLWLLGVRLSYRYAKNLKPQKTIKY